MPVPHARPVRYRATRWRPRAMWRATRPARTRPTIRSGRTRGRRATNRRCRARRPAVGGVTCCSPTCTRTCGGTTECAIDKMISTHRVTAAGRGLLLVPSVFCHKPAHPVSPDEPPMPAYPCRGVATLWAPAADATALLSLLGRSRGAAARPRGRAAADGGDRRPPPRDPERRVSTCDTGLVTRARDGRQVLYRRSSLGDQLAGPRAVTTGTRRGKALPADRGGPPGQRSGRKKARRSPARSSGSSVGMKWPPTVGPRQCRRSV
jgi:hypothetical protein